jgi:hypothetical protein
MPRVAWGSFAAGVILTLIAQWVLARSRART